MPQKPVSWAATAYPQGNEWVTIAAETGKGRITRMSLIPLSSTVRERHIAFSIKIDSLPAYEPTGNQSADVYARNFQNRMEGTDITGSEWVGSLDFNTSFVFKVKHSVSGSYGLSAAIDYILET